MFTSSLIIFSSFFFFDKHRHRVVSVFLPTHMVRPSLCLVWYRVAFPSGIDSAVTIGIPFLPDQQSVRLYIYFRHKRRVGGRNSGGNVVSELVHAVFACIAERSGGIRWYMLCERSFGLGMYCFCCHPYCIRVCPHFCWTRLV